MNTDLLSLVICIWLLFFLSFVMHLDSRRPMSEKLKYKYRVRDNSILRKIIKLKDTENNPCNYFKIIPVYVFLMLAIISSIVLVVDILTQNLISNFVSSQVFLILTVCILVLSIVYFLVISIWWEVVYNNELKEFKTSQEEFDELRKKYGLKK